MESLEQGKEQKLIQEQEKEQGSNIDNIDTYHIVITKKNGKLILIDIETDTDIREKLRDDRTWSGKVLILGDYFINMEEVSDIKVEGGK